MLLVAFFFTKSICLALFYLELFIFIFTSSTQTCANVGIESVPFCNDWRGNQSPLPVADMMIWYNPGDSLFFFSLHHPKQPQQLSLCGGFVHVGIPLRSFIKGYRCHGKGDHKVQKLQGVANLRAASLRWHCWHCTLGGPRRGDVKFVDKVDMVLWNRVNPTIVFF